MTEPPVNGNCRERVAGNFESWTRSRTTLWTNYRKEQWPVASLHDCINGRIFEGFSWTL